MIIGIFGTGRNGSSLITRLLDGLGNTYVHPVEENFACIFNEMARDGQVGRLVIQNCTTRPLKLLQNTVDASLLRAYFSANIETLDRDYIKQCKNLHNIKDLNSHAVLSRDAYVFPDFVADYLSGIARKVRPDLPIANYVFKSIETPYIADYSRAIPQMRFIHIIRDPIAVCSSQKRSLLENKKLPASYLGYDWLTCMLMKRWIPHARYLAGLNSSPVHLIVRYEDLVVAPHREIERIAGWLSLSPPPRPDRQTVFCDLDMESWGFNPSKKGVKTPTTVVPDLQAINKYGEILTTREIDLINAKTAPYLELLGYAARPSRQRLTLFVQHLLPDKWEVMHCKGPRSWLRALVGMAYRRFQIVFS